MKAIALNAVGVDSTSRRKSHPLIDDVTLDVDSGAWVCLLGPNGAGKSTLLRAMYKAMPYRGSISLLGQQVRSMPELGLAQMVAVVTQSPLFPTGMSVFDYVLLGRTPHLRNHLRPGRVDFQVTTETLRKTQIEHLADRELTNLSGGEQRRVAIARALAQQTPIVLFDEPTASLDLGSQFQILDLIEEVRRNTNMTVVSTLHDLTLAGQFADKIAVMHQGRLVASGAPSEVITPSCIRTFWGIEARITLGPGGNVEVTASRSASTSTASRSNVTPDTKEHCR